MEDILPDAFGGPADETIVKRLARAVGRRGIDPAATALQHMNDPADDSAIINPWFAACVAWKMRLSETLNHDAPDSGISQFKVSPRSPSKVMCVRSLAIEGVDQGAAASTQSL
jgi:hypothetical protein